MKSFKKLTILGTVCLSSMIATSVFATNSAKVNSETARMRSEASTTSSIVTLISMNEEVEILEETGEWCKVKYDGKTGYMSKTLLNIENEESSNSTSAESTDIENEESSNSTSTESTNTEIEENSTLDNVTTEADTAIVESVKGKLNSKIDVRILPLINSTKILVISENASVEVIEVVNNWCSIKSGNNYGWVLKSQLEEKLELTKTESNVETDEEEVKDENNDQEQEIEKEETSQDNKVEETETTETTEQTSKTGYVNVDTVNLRKEKSTTSTIITSLNKNAEVEILGEEDNWTKVKVNGSTGFIASKYISDKKIETTTSRGTDESRNTNILSENQNEVSETSTDNLTNTDTTSNASSEISTTSSNTGTTSATSNSNTETTTSTSKNGAAVVAYAKQFLGCKYVSGGMSPTTGFDCSGFTSYVYKHFGVTLSRTSSGQKSNGTEVEKANLQPGDIVCFTGHVGIYIGGNQFIHAANAKKGVIITSMSDSYYVKNYITARRIF